ncbi:MAG: LacI family DNA-binding transcriptional regulator [Lachnospiraceae bacterium]|nr:LacI family DNA-binding transcriptional regulator [Lachnospiraceae bacterium]
MNATIKDIAADTGLSLATISKYLNNKPVRPENSSLIAASIEKLNYVPNITARSLRSARSHIIGAITPTLNNNFWGTVLGYLEEELRQNGYSVIFCSHQQSDEKYSETVRALLDKQIDGAILIPYSQTDSKLVQSLSSKIPCLSLDHILANVEMDAVTSANYEGGYQAIRYLIEHGHRQIGILAGPPENYTASQRTAGALDALRDANIPIAKDLIAYTKEFTPQEGKRAFRNIMAASVLPTALFPVNYDMCLGAVIEINANDYEIPEDFSIIGFDDDIIFSSMNPTITVIKQNVKEMGRQAARLLLRRIEGDSSGYPELIKIPTTLIERESVKQL